MWYYGTLIHNIFLYNRFSTVSEFSQALKRQVSSVVYGFSVLLIWLCGHHGSIFDLTLCELHKYTMKANLEAHVCRLSLPSLVYSRTFFLFHCQIVMAMLTLKVCLSLSVLTFRLCSCTHR